MADHHVFGILLRGRSVVGEWLGVKTPSLIYFLKLFAFSLKKVFTRDIADLEFQSSPVIRYIRCDPYVFS